MNIHIRALAVLVLVGCTGDDGGGSGDRTYSCTSEHLCYEYTGDATHIDSIRASSMCVDQGGTEGTGCGPGALGVCRLAANASTGTSGAQHYYDVDADFLMSTERACVDHGGTWETP